MMSERPTNNEKLIITIKTFFGLEEVLKDELAELGFPNAEILNRAVQIEGTWRDIYFLNIHLRCGIAVLVKIKTFRIKKEQDLYDLASKIDWTKYFTIDKTFAVKGAVFSDIFRHSQYPFLLVKDAIVDQFRDKLKERPDVNVKTPQVLFDVYINQEEVTISLNTSGTPLFQRGYRESVGEAPLNEVVAAGMIRLSGWDKKSPLIDPFCGAGTILIEAALMAANIPANIERHHFAFKNFKNFDSDLYDEIRNAIDSKVRELPCQIMGSDISDEMITKTRRNLRGFAFGRFVETKVLSFEQVQKIGEKGTVITNPPYGERMGDEVEEMYGEIGNWMKNEMTGYECWIISSNLMAFKFVGLKPSKKIRLYNGNLECSFRQFSVYEGSKKDQYEEKEEEV